MLNNGEILCTLFQSPQQWHLPACGTGPRPGRRHGQSDTGRFFTRDLMPVGVCTRFSPRPSLSPTGHWSVLHFYNFVFSRMLHKWNHIVCNLLGLPFLTRRNFLEIQLACINDCFFFSCWVVFCGVIGPWLV